MCEFVSLAACGNVFDCLLLAEISEGISDVVVLKDKSCMSGAEFSCVGVEAEANVSLFNAAVIFFSDMHPLFCFKNKLQELHSYDVREELNGAHRCLEFITNSVERSNFTSETVVLKLIIRL